MGVRFLSILVYLLCVQLLFGQAQIWTLEACLDTAVRNNPSVRQMDLDANLAKINEQMTQYAFTPTLSGSGSHIFNFGRIIDPVTNEFIQSSRQNTVVNANASLVLFQGMARYYQLKQAGLNYHSQFFNKKITVRNMKLQVLTFYLQALVNTEIIRLSSEHANYTLRQKERLIRLIETGNAVPADLIEVESQMAQDNLTELRAKNEKKIALQRLKQIMLLPQNTALEIDTNFTDILEDTSAFKRIDQLPDVELRRIAIESAILNRKIAQSAYFPSLTFSASLGTSYSDGFFEPSPDDSTMFVVPEFRKQFGQNLYQTVSVSLNIPIYNQNRNKFNVQKQKIEIDKANLELETIKWELVNTIEQLNIDIENAKGELMSSMRLLDLSEQDFENVQSKYNQGIVSYADLLLKKDRLFEAQSNVIQNKYNYYFKIKIRSLYYE